MTAAEDVETYSGIVPHTVTSDVRRVMWQALHRYGMTATEFGSYQEAAGAMNAVKYSDEMRRLQSVIDRAWSWGHDLRWATPQPILHLPDFGEADMVAHTDDVPGLVAIVAVALTIAGPLDGCLHVRKHDGSLAPITMLEGDVTVLGPDVPHTAGINTGDRPRMAVYFRRVRQ